jgi:hypothetical protein
MADGRVKLLPDTGKKLGSDSNSGQYAIRRTVAPYRNWTLTLISGVGYSLSITLLKSLFMTRTFLVGVKGESHSNENGTSRQEIIKRLKVGEHVKLVPDPTNVHDRWAVKVLSADGLQIGWLPSDARDADALIKGEPITATVHALRGGTNWFNRLIGKKFIGVVLAIIKSEPDWKRRQMLQDAAKPFDKQVEKALELEKLGDIDAAIVAFKQVIADVKVFTKENPYASAHRNHHLPIDRLSMALERKKLHEEALAVIRDWENTFDPVQPTKTVSDTIRKRLERLKNK